MLLHCGNNQQSHLWLMKRRGNYHDTWPLDEPDNFIKKGNNHHSLFDRNHGNCSHKYWHWLSVTRAEWISTSGRVCERPIRPLKATQSQPATQGHSRPLTAIQNLSGLEWLWVALTGRLGFSGLVWPWAALSRLSPLSCWKISLSFGSFLSLKNLSFVWFLAFVKTSLILRAMLCSRHFQLKFGTVFEFSSNVWFRYGELNLVRNVNAGTVNKARVKWKRRAIMGMGMGTPYG